MGYFDGGSAEVGKNIAVVRKLRGLTQQQLANKLGITQSAVSKFEVHGDKIHRSTLAKLGEVLEVDPVLLNFKDLNDKGGQYHDAIVHAIKTYAPEDQYQELVFDIDYEIEQRRIGMYTGSAVSPEEAEVIDLFGKLNTNGKREAVKRIEELTQLAQYRKVD